MDQSILLAVFIFVAAAVLVVPFAKATGLGSVLGYLVAGVIIGPYALRLVTDPQTILHFSEFGVVMMLFLIGLELQPRELWRMKNRLLGLGTAQLGATAALFAALGLLFGLPWQSALVAGMALGLSSTAIALQIMGERGIMQTEAGRSGFAVLLFQDIAVIPALALVPLLALPHLTGAGLEQATHAAADGHAATAAEAGPGEPGWLLALRIIGVFAGMFLAGRFILRPLMRFIAHTGVREIFTALALFLVVGAALAMEWLDLSHALGAFLAGCILADSEYRHELQSDIEPFKGLLLGLFFISVGMSVEFSVLLSSPVTILLLVAGLVVFKFAILYALSIVFRMHLADRLLFAILLAQGGEFAFVLLQFALGAGAIDKDVADMLNVTAALSMTITPLLVLAFDRLVAPRLQAPLAESPGIPEMGDTNQKVLVLGYGRFGQIVARLLHAQGFETTLIDHNPAQIELVKRFGWKVFYGDVARLDLLNAAGAGSARLIVVTLKEPEKSMQLCTMIKRHFPNAKLYVRAFNRAHAFELIDMGVEGYERETFHSALKLGVKALVGLGYSEHRALRLAKAFERHDQEVLEQSAKLRGDEDALTSYVLQSSDLLATVMASDEAQGETHGGADRQPDHGDIDTEAQARSE